MKLIKNELQSQVIETEDSFSTIYNIIQEVDSLEIEQVFAGAINAVERIMKTDKVSIYVISRNGDRGFMRLKARSIALNDMIPNSIKIDENPRIKEVIEKKRLYVNKNLEEDVPVMVYPIIDGGAAIGVALIHETAFENLTRRYENLFITVMGLISNALKRAYFFEESLKDKRFIPGTRILIPEIFEKVLAEIKNYKEELGMSYSLLEVSKGQKNYRLISERISSGIRENDYIGLSKKGDIYILLSNTNNNYAGLVVERLETKGIKSKIKKEELADELSVSR
jgi:hypothetical protein